jgi:hypothetical protein
MGSELLNEFPWCVIQNGLHNTVELLSLMHRDRFRNGFDAGNDTAECTAFSGGGA